jgi:hypothetical protein
MQVNAPLTLTLSPSDGAREKSVLAAYALRNIRFNDCSPKAYSLAPSDGERVRVRGALLLGRVAFCRPWAVRAHRNVSTLCRLQIGLPAEA